MTDQRDGREPKNPDRKGFGDNQGTRVGKPTPGSADEPGHLGAGHEAVPDGTREESETHESDYGGGGAHKNGTAG